MELSVIQQIKKQVNASCNNGGKVQYMETIHKILQDTWHRFRLNNINPSGRPTAIIDKVDISEGSLGKKITFSETVAYTLFRAVLMDDQATFNDVFRWAKKNIQRKNVQQIYDWQRKKWINMPDQFKDHLFSWRYTPNIAGSGVGGIVWVDPKLYNGDIVWRSGLESAPDSEQIIAFSLLVADKKWGNNSIQYRNEALNILTDIWKCIKEFPGFIDNFNYGLSSKWFTYPNGKWDLSITKDDTLFLKSNQNIKAESSSGFGLNMDSLDLSHKSGLVFRGRGTETIKEKLQYTLQEKGGHYIIIHDTSGNKLISKKKIKFSDNWKDYKVNFNQESFQSGHWVDGKFTKTPYNNFQWDKIDKVIFHSNMANSSVEIDDIFFIENNKFLLSNDLSYPYVNSSYYHPAFYKTFAKVDKAHDWESMISSAYYTYKTSSQATMHDADKQPYQGDGTLIPDWVSISKEGAITDFRLSEVANLPDYVAGWESYRIIFEMSLDYLLTDNPKAQEMLSGKMYQFYKNTLSQKGFINAGYGINKWPVENFGLNVERFGMNGAYLSLFLVNKDQKMSSLMVNNILKYYHEDGLFGDDAEEYFEQHWAWFGLWIYLTDAKELRELLCNQ